MAGSARTRFYIKCYFQPGSETNRVLSSAEGKIHIVAAHFVCQYVPMMTVLFERTQIVFLIIGMYHNLSSRSEHPCEI